MASKCYVPTNNSYYSSTSNPHRRSHRRLRVSDNRQGAGGETPLSETRRGGIRHAVVQSPAIAVARRARARPPPPGPPPGPSRHRCRPPLPPARDEPRPPHPALYLPASILVVLTPAREGRQLLLGRGGDGAPRRADQRPALRDELGGGHREVGRRDRQVTDEHPRHTQESDHAQEEGAQEAAQFRHDGQRGVPPDQIS